MENPRKSPVSSTDPAVAMVEDRMDLVDVATDVARAAVRP